MTTEINQLALRLPNGFERRAQRIGRLIGEALARRNLPAGRVDRIRVGPRTADPRHSDRSVAERIADTIPTAINRHAQPG